MRPLGKESRIPREGEVLLESSIDISCNGQMLNAAVRVWHIMIVWDEERLLHLLLFKGAGREPFVYIS